MVFNLNKLYNAEPVKQNSRLYLISPVVRVFPEFPVLRNIASTELVLETVSGTLQGASARTIRVLLRAFPRIFFEMNMAIYILHTYQHPSLNRSILGFKDSFI
jgi:hypothetical protein